LSTGGAVVRGKKTTRGVKKGVLSLRVQDLQREKKKYPKGNPARRSPNAVSSKRERSHYINGKELFPKKKTKRHLEQTGSHVAGQGGAEGGSLGGEPACAFSRLLKR